MTLLMMCAIAEMGKSVPVPGENDFGKLLGKSVLVKILVWFGIHYRFLILAFFRFW